jgi:hypothetical protein
MNFFRKDPIPVPGWYEFWKQTSNTSWYPQKWIPTRHWLHSLNQCWPSNQWWVDLNFSKNRLFWVFEKNQNQRTDGSGYFTTMKEAWVLCGSLTFATWLGWRWGRVFGIFGLPQVIWICTCCDLWWRFRPGYRTMDFYSGNVAGKCKTFNQITMKEFVVGCLH